MTLGVTIARKGDDWSVIIGPEVAFAEQRRGFYELCKKLTGTHDEVQLISTTGGRVKRRKLKIGESGVASAESLRESMKNRKKADSSEDDETQDQETGSEGSPSQSQNLI